MFIEALTPYIPALGLVIMIAIWFAITTWSEKSKTSRTSAKRRLS